MGAEQPGHTGLPAAQFGQRVVDVGLGLCGGDGHRATGGEHLDPLERIGQGGPAPEQFGGAEIGLGIRLVVAASSSAAPRSASNSRDRLIAIWISEAAIGASSDMSSIAIGFGRSSSSRPPANIEANMAIWAMYEIAVAIAAATDPMRMSRCLTCISSWAITPSIS